jgi:hypothetical protein
VVEVDSDTPAQRTRSIVSGDGTSASYAAWNSFRDNFIAGLRFDDPGQMLPRNAGPNFMRLSLPGRVNVTLFRSAKPQQRIGAYLRFIDPDAIALYNELLTERAEIDAEFAAAGLAGLVWRDDGEDKGRVIALYLPSPLPWDAAREAEQRDWLGRVANQFVNSLRPRLSRIIG